MDKIDFKIDWCNYDAAKYACENWHYTKKIPVNKLVKIGLWENEMFKGVLLFGLGASAQIYKRYKIKQIEMCELVRIALNKHIIQVSQFISVSIRLLKKKCPGLKMIISFADPSQNHSGVGCAERGKT